jgi:hypothetical protein
MPYGAINIPKSKPLHRLCPYSQRFPLDLTAEWITRLSWR